MMKRIALPFLFALTIFSLPSAVHAQRRSPLADAPAIRKRIELRETRFEVGAGFMTTINQSFYHGLMVGGRLSFHITDWLALTAVGGANVTNLSTGFHDRLLDALPSQAVPRPMPDFRAPSDSTANSGLNKMAFFGAGQVEATFFTGKYSLFGKLFANYDFYVFGGAAAVNFAAVNSGASKCTSSPANDGVCVASGMQFGGTLGGGFHSFFNDFIALNVELRDIIVRDNPAGRDVDGDQNVDTGDLTWMNHFMATFGLTFFLPTTASISP